ncbi:hypothetical protein RN001_016251 [Aquatica leii]|uniref:COMM domain-containing protein 5 n=1 Tax=Aquatica leii TaxID=1421715 RepID=A0AAN7NXC2_9COLE|nr:hypothetical protein RN001_016251 [Aquatica leii]
MTSLMLNNHNKNIIQLASRLPLQAQEVLITTALDATIHNNSNLEILENVFKSVELDTEDSLDLIGVFITITNIFLRNDEKQFWETLTTAGFNEAFIQNFLVKHKASISSIKSRNVPKMSGFKWRIDISFACGFLKKQVPPTIIVNLQLSSGEKYVFEIDLKTFHKLRFNIALALKEMNSLEKLSVVKNNMI